MFYNLFLHPLRSFPGPLLWRVSPLPRAYWMLRAKLPYKIAALHERYGTAVRISPGAVAFSSPEAWSDIYGHRKAGQPEFAKYREFYMSTSDTEAHSIILAGREEHGALRRAMAHGFSEKAMRGQEPIIGSYVDLLIAKLRAHAATGAPANMREWLNWTTFDVIGDLGFGSAFGCLRDGDYHPWVRLITTTFRHDAFFQALNDVGLRRLAIYIASRGGNKHRREHLALCKAKVAQRGEQISVFVVACFLLTFHL